MANWHGYILVQNIDLTDEAWQSWVDELSTLQGTNDSNANKLQLRFKPDNTELLLEANFDQNEIAFGEFRKMLARAMETTTASVKVSENQVILSDTDSTLLGFTKTSILRGTTIYFGMLTEGDYPDWEVSRQECLAYLSLHDSEWNGE